MEGAYWYIYRPDMFDRAVPISVGFTSLRLVIVLKTFHHLLSQSEVTAKPGMARSGSFSHPSRQLHVTASRFDWFTGLSLFILIGKCHYFDGSMYVSGKLPT